MAPPDQSSQSPTSTLIPFLSGRSRRGSLASIASRTDIDKDALAQALDVIHTSASKSGGLTSFHDYDGGNTRAGAKELVSSGVTGLYNKLRQSVGSPPPAEQKTVKTQPGTTASKTSVATTESRSGGLLPSTRSTVASSTKASPSTASLATLSPTSSAVDASVSGGLGAKLTKEESRSRSTLKSEDSILSTGGGQRDTSGQLSRADSEKTKSGPSATDEGEGANDTKAAPAQQKTAKDDPSPARSQPADSTSGEAIDDDADLTDTPEDDSNLPEALEGKHIEAIKSMALGEVDKPSREPQRPPLVKVGVSHLPGFEPSATASTVDDGDNESIDSSYTNTRRPAPEYGSNINSALQRRRNTPKTHSTPVTQPLSLASHLKRRILSKEFCKGWRSALWY